MISYRIILPYQEEGHEDRPWFLARVDALDKNDVIGYLKMAWVDYEWVRNNYELTKKLNGRYSHKQTWQWLSDRADWVYVDYSRVSHIYRRQKIATRMYNLGAAWLALNRHTCLHSSSLQSDKVEALWAYFKRQTDMPIYRVSGRHHSYDCLDYSQTPALRLRARRILEDTPQIKEPVKITFKQTDPDLLEFRRTLSKAAKGAGRVHNG